MSIDIDREIAIKVMGWTETPKPDKYLPRVINRYKLPILDVDEVGQNGAYWDEEVVFEPSANIAHAWEVVDHIHRHWIFSQRKLFEDALSGQVRLQSGELIAWPGAILFLKPHHICLAALAAVGAGKGEEK